MSVVTTVATIKKKVDNEVKNFGSGNINCGNLCLLCDFGFVFAGAYGDTLNAIKHLNVGDRVTAVINVKKMAVGSSGPYMAGKLLDISPVTITNSAILNDNIAKDERVVHDETPIEERKTTRSGKKRIETHYELAAVTDEETETYEEQEESDNPFVENYSEVPW